MNCASATAWLKGIALGCPLALFVCTRIRTGPKDASIRERQTGKRIHSARDTQVLRQRCNDIRPAHVVEDDVRGTEEMRVRLTVLAVAHAATASSRHGHLARQPAASALQGMSLHALLALAQKDMR